MKHDKDAITLRVEFAKRGGQPKEKYQAYVLAFLDKNANKVPAAAPRDLIDPDAVLVLHTQSIARGENGRYALEFRIDDDALAKKVIAHNKLGENDRAAPGGWGSYNDRIRLAVFIPFLDDETYSILPELPGNKHECNYARERALLFQELPYALCIRFGIVDATRLEPDTHRIGINSDKRPKL